jgi:BMFP domain-containing protein YqiC
MRRRVKLNLASTINMCIRSFPREIDQVFENKLDAKKLDELARGVLDKLPSGFQAMQHDMEKTLRAALQSSFAKLDLVSRDEFDVQSAVLQRTREKLEALEAMVAELEARLR